MQFSKGINNTKERQIKMSIVLIKSDNQRSTLSQVQYIEEDVVKYFKITNEEVSEEVKVEYIPVSKCDWDKERFDIYLLESKYLDAENDVFEVKENTIDERLGWIFPITILGSNENDFKDYRNLNNYKYISYLKLLELDIKLDYSEAGKFLNISDLFPDLIICILSKEATNKIAGFNFNNYTLSLYQYLYLPYNGQKSAIDYYKKDTLVTEIRGRKSIKLIKSRFDISSNTFTDLLFYKHLIQIDNDVVRFVFLYQIIEHYIQLDFDIEFNKNLELYQKGQLMKNDFKEKINKASKEKESISRVFTDIVISTQIATDFIQECNEIFNVIGLENDEQHLPHRIYSMRNLITHNFREIANHNISLKRVTEIFEDIIVESLINYN